MLRKILGFLGGPKAKDRESESSDAHRVSPSMNAESLFKEAGEAFDRDDFCSRFRPLCTGHSTSTRFRKSSCNAGLSLQRARQFSKSKNHLLKAVELKADLADAWYLLGSIASIEKEADTAISHWQRSLEFADSRAHLC